MLAVHGTTGTLIGTTATHSLTSLGYSGEHFDAKAQQQYLRARFYDPANGQFNRLDPFAGNIHDPQSLNKYAYVHGDPIGMTDPTGMFGLGGTIASIGLHLSLQLPTVMTGALVTTTVMYAGDPAAQLRRHAITLMASGDFDHGFVLYEIASRILALVFSTAEQTATAIDAAGVGLAVVNLVRAAPRLGSSLVRGLQAAKNSSAATKILNAVNRSPQIVKALGAANRQVIDTSTYLQGLVNLEDYAHANGWTLIADKPYELVSFGKTKATTEINASARTNRINLTAESNDSVRLIEFADEVSHAVNAINGTPNSNSMVAHVGYFADAAASTLIPYTSHERSLLLVARDVLAEFADAFD